MYCIQEKMIANNKKILFLSIFGLIILMLAYFQNEKEISLSRNKALTIGKVIEFEICSGSKPIKKCIVFKYLIDGKWIDGKERDNQLWPKVVREGKPQIGKYYYVEYDKTNFEYSKILISESPLSIRQTDKYLN